METDKKIEDYLERAYKMLKEKNPDMREVIEIAKMIDQEIDGIKFKKLLQDQYLDAKNKSKETIVNKIIKRII